MEDNGKTDAGALKDESLGIPKGGLITFGVALFLHSLIDGLAVGVFSDIGQLSVVGVSVILHKIPVAFTLGYTFSKSNQTLDMLSTRIILTLFLISSPLGVLLGAFISASAYDYALMIIQALSAGTFVYLATVDLIVHEFQNSEMEMTPKIKSIKFLALMSGWAFVIFLMTILPSHEGE